MTLADKRRIPARLCCLLWSFAFLLSGCGGTINADSKNAPAPKEVPTLKAETMLVQLQRWPTVVRSQGSLHPDEQAVIGAKIGGRVDQVHVEIGDFVQQGDSLATLDQQEARLRVMQTEAQLLQARATVGLETDQTAADLNPQNAAPVREAKAIWDETVAVFKRAQLLKDRNALSAAEFDQAAAAERVAEAQHISSLNAVAERLAVIRVREAELALAKQQLIDSVVKAPFSGYIQQRDIAPGAYVATGQAIAVLVQTSPLRFRGAVPERFAQSLRLGQDVRLTIQSVPTPVAATVTRISPMLDPRSRTLMFEADVDNEDQQLRTGLFAEAEVVIDPDANAIVLPKSAVVEFAGNQKVWKVVDGVTVEQTITTSEFRGNLCRVDEGVNVGDQLLVDGDRGLVAKVIAPGSPSKLPTSETTTPASETPESRETSETHADAASSVREAS
ncbi:efflux RND transporter periplasmic adaptor subunit [Stieleria sp. TO1_6]|uniref:efflux RND transporter periplasmic adaptor subunit n=1 Tax=Stieleria tagensis TaxID=2956795 RepID=UPI00209A8CA8|nr:efflux RND transporter periplasmic adaptor subunit [Stieleria tagensis]MCO8125131.1 efflux RND transporter periplasmic adaptor subunit [Stieleria tagensis]